jgi:hypothetical protein
MDKAKTVLAAAVFLGLCFCWQIASAQVSVNGSFGAVSGRVVDPTGAGIPGVQVVIFQEPNLRNYEVVTDCSGFYLQPELTAGNYTVKFAFKGFRNETRTSIHIDSSKDTQLDIKMQVGQFTDWGPTAEEVTTNTLPDDAKKQVEAREVNGKVMDASGVVPARITATELATRKRYQTTTDSRGDYRFAHLPAGNYCTKFEASGSRYGMPGAQYETSREVRVSPEGRAELNVALPAIPEQIVVCSASCPIHTRGEPPTVHSIVEPPIFEPKIYAAHNVIEPGQELWIDIDLKNISGHNQFIRTENGLIASADFQIYVTGECGCPGPLLKHNMSVDLRKSAPNGWSKKRIKKGAAFSERIDLSKLVKLDRPGKYMVFVEHLKDLNDADSSENKPRPIQSNIIIVEVMAARH